MKTLPQLLDEVAKLNEHKTAISDQGRKLTYGTLLKMVHRFSARLREHGIRQGDSVALVLPNGIEFVVSFLAAAHLGASVVPLNWRYQENELIYFMGDSRASALVTVKDCYDLCRRACDNVKYECDLLVLDHGTKFEVTGGGVDREEGSDLFLEEIRPDDRLVCQYSSGSTGHSKRISRSHVNLVFELNSLAKTLEVNSQDKFLGVVPFSHVNGLVRSMLLSLSVGATLIPLREFKRRKTLTTIEEEEISVFIGVPFMFHMLAETNCRELIDLSVLRLNISASATMPVAVNRKFRERYGHYVRQLYGSTETGTISVNMGGEIENSLDSVGLPIAGVEVTVFRDDGTVADIDETGEVGVKSPAAIKRYDSVSDHAGPFRDGYFLTGDLGRVGRNGYLYLVGRKKFFINKGGYKINPWEVETLLTNHPKVEDVVVLGAPTPYGDERVKAVVVPRSPCSEEELVEYCHGKIADFKIPSFIEFRENLSKGPTGKVLRKKLE